MSRRNQPHRKEARRVRAQEREEARQHLAEILAAKRNRHPLGLWGYLEVLRAWEGGAL